MLRVAVSVARCHRAPWRWSTWSANGGATASEWDTVSKILKAWVSWNLTGLWWPLIDLTQVNEFWMSSEWVLNDLVPAPRCLELRPVSKAGRHMFPAGWIDTLEISQKKLKSQIPPQDFVSFGVYFGSCHMRVSIDGGSRRSSILIGFSSINHPAIGVPTFLEPPKWFKLIAARLPGGLAAAPKLWKTSASWTSCWTMNSSRRWLCRWCIVFTYHI